MPSRRLVSAALAVSLLAASAWPAAAAPALKVVASFSILGDFVRQVGGDRVAVTTLVGPDGDSHVFTPTPDDARKVAEAALVVVNGLGLEGWMPRLVKAAGGRARLVTASDGISPRKPAPAEHAHHDIDPHAWQSVGNAKIYVGDIRDALIAADPAGAETYRANAAAYLARLDALDAEVRAAIARIPAERRRVISTHDAFGYFARDYGLRFIAPQGLSTDADIGAGDVAALVRQVRAEKIPAVFLENLSDPRLMRQLAAESGAKIGGTLYSDALSAENGPAPTYIDMVRHNIRALTGALAP
jgi:zinc/manganese transport system substrate-binding protein